MTACQRFDRDVTKSVFQRLFVAAQSRAVRGEILAAFIYPAQIVPAKRSSSQATVSTVGPSRRHAAKLAIAAT